MINYKEIVTKNVSRETFLRILEYKEMLDKWNKSFDLTALSDDAFYQSVCEVIEVTKGLGSDCSSIYDLGSGNGIPGVLLALIAGRKLSLVERSRKRCVFLSEVNRRLGLGCNIVNNDITQIEIMRPSVVISKAVSSVGGIIELLNGSIANIRKIVLLKKKSQLHEIQKAEINHDFKAEVLENKFDGDNVIIVVSGISLR